MSAADAIWEFHLPTPIRFGDGCSAGLAAAAATLGKRPLLATDRVLRGLPLVQRLVEALGSTQVFDRIEPNPTVAAVDALAAWLREVGADVVIAVGGGSVMDCAKAAGALAPRGDAGIRPWHAAGQVPAGDRLPVIAVPTTAGTGAEVTPFAVLDDPERGVKAPIAGPSLYPALAVVDPELTHGLPLAVTAATGLDALCHALEAYWSRNHQPMCDLLAMEAARLIFRWFETVCRTPAHREGRRAMAYAATVAGAAFQLPKNAMVHACSYPLSSRFHLPHGSACAFTLEYAIRLNAPAMGSRMTAFAAHCGFAGAEAMAAAVTRLKQAGGLPCTLAEAGIPPEAVDGLVDASFHPLMQNNPVPVTREHLHDMYRQLA